jgi:hypothetical protein
VRLILFKTYIRRIDRSFAGHSILNIPKSRIDPAANSQSVIMLRGNQKVLEFVRNAQRKSMLCLQVYSLHDISGHLGYTKIDGQLR